MAQIEELIKHDLIRNLPARRCEPFHMHRQHPRRLINCQTLARIYQLLALLALVLVVPSQIIWLDEAFERVFDVRAGSDVE